VGRGAVRIPPEGGTTNSEWAAGERAGGGLAGVRLLALAAMGGVI